MWAWSSIRTRPKLQAPFVCWSSLVSHQWQPAPGELKCYPHFDLPLSEQELIAIANDPARVAGNAFFPFLVNRISWIPYRGEGQSEPKVRLVRYASRRDSAIYTRYRALLSERYEAQLAEAGLGECVLGYRRIPVRPGGPGGKCNIHFAKEVFESIVRLGDCCAVVMDIASFFDNIDHARLKLAWCRMLGVNRLPADHYAVYKSLTRHASVSRSEALSRLGLQGHKASDQRLPIQLCSPQVFRHKIAGQGGALPSLIAVNRQTFGIPQGAAISDVLANIYLMDFDRQMQTLVGRLGGIYRRYSDDLLFLVPGGPEAGQAVAQQVGEQLPRHGDQLRIQEAKSQIVAFRREGELCRVASVATDRGRNGLEYLGFRFDGRQAYLRDSTLSRLYRKLSHACKREAIRLSRGNPTRTPQELLAMVDFQRLEKRFGRVEDFDPANVRNWTFWTYARRADRILGPMGRPVIGQVRRYREFIRRTLKEQLGA